MRASTHRSLRSRGLACLLAGGLVVIAACGDDDDDGAADTAEPAATTGSTTAGTTTASTSGGSAPSAGEPLEIAQFVAIQANPVEEVIIKTAADVAAADGNVNITVFDANNDPQAQIAQCQDALAQNKFDAFILKAVAGPTMMDCAEQAIAQDIEVVAMGNALGPDSASVELQVEGLSASVIHSATTNGEGLYELVDLACAENDEPPCEVIYLFGPLAFDYSSISRDVLYGLLDERDDIEVVAEQTQNFNPDEAINATRQLLPANPGTDVLAMDCSFCAVPVADVLAELDLADEVLLVASAADAASIEQVKNGQQFGEVLLLPATESRLATEFAIKAARGEDLGDDVTVDVAKDYSPTGSIIITQENAGDFTAEWPLGS
jgi:ribose transport system substrate-binding protein